jgi:hypothetical protein
MTDLTKNMQDALAKYRLPLKRDQVKQARDFAAPAMRFAARNPILLIGAGLVAIAGVVAFTNRKKIAARAGPVIDDAKAKGQAMLDDASAKGQELLETAKAKGEEIAGKVRARRTGDGMSPTDVH